MMPNSPYCYTADPRMPEALYCAMGIVVEVPPFADRNPAKKHDWAGKVEGTDAGTGGASSNNGNQT
jgi:hypothetical protein